MNALEHVAFMLSTAVGFDEIEGDEMRDFLGELIDASMEFGEEVNTMAMQQLSAKLGRRFGHLISPKELD